MSATTVTRRPYAGSHQSVPGSSIASTTSTQLSSLYPTPATTVSSSSAYRLGGPASSGAANSGAGIRTGGSGMPGQAPYAPSIRTAGDSWSLQRDGEKTVIVIEDTPPPTTSTNVASTRTSAIASSSRLPAANGAPNKRVKVGGYPQSNDVYASSYQQPNYGVDTLSIAAHPATASTSAYHPDASAAASTSNANRKVSGAKRKFNEVNDPATANDRLYQQRKDAAIAALPCDDKDGHYIIRPDDELGDTRRYKIIRLLGQGTFGKVVEAWDRDARCTVAVKVIRAIQKYRDASKIEVKVLNLLRDRDPTNVNKCIHLLDVFDHRNHICIVTKLLSCSVFDFLKDNNYLPFPASHIQSFARQLLTSVAFLHDLRLVHTDLKPENILLVDHDYVGIPIRPNKSAPTVKTKRILKSSAIHLIDFGSATFEEEYHASVVSTRHYRAPEIILGLGWSYPCDVWSIGCILVEFFTGEALFQTHENLEHLAMMEIVFGRLPESRWGKSAVRAKPEWFSSGTKVNYPTPATTRQSKKYVKAMRALEAIVSPTNIVNSRFLDLLSHLLKWDPADRYTVREALRHPFFSLKIDDDETRGLNQLA